MDKPTKLQNPDQGPQGMVQKAIGSAPNRTLSVPWFLTPEGYNRFKASRWAQAWELMRREPRLYKLCWTCMHELTEPKETLPAWPDLDRPFQQAFKQDQRSFLAAVGFRPALWSGPLCVTFNCTVPNRELLTAFQEDLADPGAFATFIDARGEPAAFSFNIGKLDLEKLETKERDPNRWKWSAGRNVWVNLHFSIERTPSWRLAQFRNFLERSPFEFRQYRETVLRRYGAKSPRKRATRAKSIALGLALHDEIAKGIGAAQFTRHLQKLSVEQLHEDLRVAGHRSVLTPGLPRAVEKVTAERDYSKRLREYFKQVQTLSDRFLCRACPKRLTPPCVPSKADWWLDFLDELGAPTRKADDIGNARRG